MVVWNPCKVIFPHGLFIVMLDGLSKRETTHSLTWLYKLQMYDLRLTCTTMYQVRYYKYHRMGHEVYHVAQKFAGVYVCELVIFFLQDAVFEILRGSPLRMGWSFDVLQVAPNWSFNEGCTTSDYLLPLGEKLFSYKIKSGFPG